MLKTGGEQIIWVGTVNNLQFYLEFLTLKNQQRVVLNDRKFDRKIFIMRSLSR